MYLISNSEKSSDNFASEFESIAYENMVLKGRNARLSDINLKLGQELSETQIKLNIAKSFIKERLTQITELNEVAEIIGVKA